MPRAFELAGLDGANPLGFLAALGTLVCLQSSVAGQPRLLWKRRARWIPVVEGVDAGTEEELATIVARSLRGKPVPQDAEARRASAEREMERARTAINNKRKEFRQRGLRGRELREAVERELLPLRDDYEKWRLQWLQALREAVPRPELALGQRIDCTPAEYREHVQALMASADRLSRDPLDMFASFGVDAVRWDNADSIVPTPFCFTTGSGHQNFLETARELMSRVSTESVRRTLFAPWDYRDERFSMRWDPIEDRRYALMDRDPTASGNKARTVWMANLLAYRGLALFPTAAIGRALAAAGWDAQQTSFTWPLWEQPVGLDVTRSLVQLRELIAERPDPAVLRARGIAVVYRANRVVVGAGANRKVNFSPARAIV